MSLSQAYASANPGAASGVPVVLRSVRAAIGHAIAAQRARSRARAELESYTDRQLLDLGLCRSDIPSIVNGTFSR